jgi:hypothetical protein
MRFVFVFYVSCYIYWTDVDLKGRNMSVALLNTKLCQLFSHVNLNGDLLPKYKN